MPAWCFNFEIVGTLTLSGDTYEEAKAEFDALATSEIVKTAETVDFDLIAVEPASE